MFLFKKKTRSEPLFAARKQAKYLHGLYVANKRLHERPLVPDVEMPEEETLLLTSYEVPHKETELVLLVDLDEIRGRRTVVSLYPAAHSCRLTTG